MEMITATCKKIQTISFCNSPDTEFLASNVESINEKIRIQIHRGGLKKKKCMNHR